jgi:hypothetical protein
MSIAATGGTSTAAKPRSISPTPAASHPRQSDASCVLPHSLMFPKLPTVASCKCSRSIFRLEGRWAAERRPAILPKRSRPSPLQLQLVIERLGNCDKGPNTSRCACSARQIFRRLCTVRSRASGCSPGWARCNLSSSSRPVRHGSARKPMRTSHCSRATTCSRGGEDHPRSLFCSRCRYLNASLALPSYKRRQEGLS